MFDSWFRGTCDNCNSSLKGCAYEYQIVSTKEYGWISTILVHIRTKCPRCGAIKEYDKKFDVKSEENPYYIIDTYMREMYGDRL